jgi:hypothetical protein
VTALGFDDVLDRIFEGNDVIVPVGVHLLHQRRQGSRLAAADRTGDKYETVVVLGQFLQALRQLELVHRLETGGDDAENKVDPQPLADDTRAKSSEARGVGEIDVSLLLQTRQLGFVEETLRQGQRVRRRQARRPAENRLQIAEPPPERRHVHPEVNVRGIGFLADQQVLIDMGENRVLIFGCRDRKNNGRCQRGGGHRHGARLREHRHAALTAPRGGEVNPKLLTAP